MNTLKTVFLTILIGLIPLSLFSQSVTYNADSRTLVEPHHAAAMEVFSTSKGILLPRLTYDTRMSLALNGEAMGLVVYQHDSVKGIYEWDGLRWRCLNPMEIMDDSGVIRQFAGVALTGEYLDLVDRPNIPQSIADLKEIAYTGSYNSLLDKPNIPELPAGESLDFAKVAITGNYLDLLNRPRIPQNIDDLCPIIYTGSYADLTEPFPIATKFSELLQDSLHQTVGEDDVSQWDKTATQPIPTKLSELEQDYNNTTITEKDKQTWQALLHRQIPNRLGEFAQDNFSQTITKTEREKWNTSAEKKIPALLRDLSQDSLHLLVTEADKEKWNTTAERLAFSGRYDELTDRPSFSSVSITGNYVDLKNKLPIPTKLSDMENNEYNNLVNMAEKDSWNNKSNFKGNYKDLVDTPRIPTKINELESDYEGRSVSTNNVNTWNNMAAAMDSSSWFKGSYSELKDKPKFPTKLSDMIQDSLAMTISATNQPIGERLRWEEMYNKMSSVSVWLSDYEEDELHKFISYADTSKWNTDNRRLITDTLRQLALEDSYAWVSDSIINTWNKMATAYIPSADTIASLQEMVSTMDNNDIYWGRGAENMNTSQEKFTKLKNTLDSIVYTGSYKDLKNKPYTLTANDTALFKSLSRISTVATSGLYNDLFGNHAFDIAYNRLAVTGSYDDLITKPSLKPEAKGDIYGNMEDGFTIKADRTLISPKASDFEKKSMFIGYDMGDLSNSTEVVVTSDHNVRLGANADISYPSLVSLYLSTITTDLALNNVWFNDFKEYANTAVAIPNGIIVMWSGTSNKIPLCWEIYKDFSGRFPVSVNDGEVASADPQDSLSMYMVTNFGGEEKHTLTIEELPSHSHNFTTYSGDVRKNPGTNGLTAFKATGTEGANDPHVYATTATGGNIAHENRPPYYALYFLKRNNNLCGSAKSPVIIKNL